MDNNRIIVTGGAGFIGSHLVEELSDNNEILVIDNLDEGDKSLVPETVEFKELDIRDFEELKNTVQKFEPDFVFHLAAYNDAMGSIDDAQEAIETNIAGTVNLLEACSNIGIEKFVYTSSGGLSYGESEDPPIVESTKLDPIYPYGVSKACGSMFIQDFGRRKNIDYAIMRLGSVYGPKANGGVIKNFFQKINRNERPIIYGDGTQTRDFIYVSDVVSGLLKAAKNGSGLYNLGTQTQTSIKQLLDMIKNTVNVDTAPIYRDRWEGDIDSCELSKKKSEKSLDWNPEVTLKKGLKKCESYYIDDN